MMHKLLAATLALSPLMLHAQAIMPAQPQAVSGAPGQQAKLGQTRQLLVASGADIRPAKAGARPVSTGVINPKLVYSIGVEMNPNSSCVMNNNCNFVVAMTVDTLGRPSDLKIVHSANAGMDRSVLEAVSQYRFTPAMLNNQPVAMPFRLEVDVRNSAW